MIIEDISTTISSLRKKANLTQRGLAAMLGVTDKAVSKWERGLGVPDVSLLSKLSIILDTDIESLLKGFELTPKSKWEGLLVLDNDIFLGQMVSEKPLIYYTIGCFMLVGIKKVTIICNLKNKDYLNNNKSFYMRMGIELSFTSINNLSFDKDVNIMLIHNFIFLYGVDLTRFLKRAMNQYNKIVVLSMPKNRDISRSVKFNDLMKIIDIDDQSSIKTQYDYYELPVFFCPQRSIFPLLGKIGLIKDSRDITFYTECLDRGFVDLYLKSEEDIIILERFIDTIQMSCGMQIYCLEEIAWRRGYIPTSVLYELGKEQDNNYGKYIIKLCDDKENM